MALIRQRVERVNNAGLGPHHRLRRDTDIHGDFIGGLEANAPDIRCQPVRVGTDQGNGVIPVSAVNAHGLGGAHAVAVQKNHDVTHGLLLVPGGLDLVAPLFADAFD